MVHVYYAVTCYWTNEIMGMLRNLKCPPSDLRRAYRNLMACQLDTGLTFSNYHRRETIMVIGLTSSPAEFLNSFDHERKHLEAHIAQALSINPWGEEIAYLSGDIAQKLAGDVQMFVCDCNEYKYKLKNNCNCKTKKHDYKRRFEN